MDENNEEDKIIVKEVVMRTQTEIPGPPPPDFTSPFKTIEEWLSYICDTDGPEKPILEYQFLLFEPPAAILTLSGYNTYREQGLETLRMDFQPNHMFFPLPEEEYGNLSAEQVKKTVLKKLKAFVREPKFRNSYLAKADWITTNLSDDIWPVY